MCPLRVRAPCSAHRVAPRRRCGRVSRQRHRRPPRYARPDECVGLPVPTACRCHPSVPGRVRRSRRLTSETVRPPAIAGCARDGCRARRSRCRRAACPRCSTASGRVNLPMSCRQARLRPLLRPSPRAGRALGPAAAMSAPRVERANRAGTRPPNVCRSAACAASAWSFAIVGSVCCARPSWLQAPHARHCRSVPGRSTQRLGALHRIDDLFGTRRLHHLAADVHGRRRQVSGGRHRCRQHDTGRGKVVRERAGKAHALAARADVDERGHRSEAPRVSHRIRAVLGRHAAVSGLGQPACKIVLSVVVVIHDDDGRTRAPHAELESAGLALSSFARHCTGDDNRVRYRLCFVAVVLSPELLTENIAALTKAQGGCPTLGALPDSMRVAVTCNGMQIEARTAEGWQPLDSPISVASD